MTCRLCILWLPGITEILKAEQHLQESLCVPAVALILPSGACPVEMAAWRSLGLHSMRTQYHMTRNKVREGLKTHTGPCACSCYCGSCSLLIGRLW